MTIDQRLEKLRKIMKDNRIDAVIVPSSDSHQSEYVADHWKAREWISGFTGSAGWAVITGDHAGVWTDSRYYLQAEEELSTSQFVLHKVLNYTPDFVEFLLGRLPEGSRVACDGRVFSKSEIDGFRKSFGTSNIDVEVDLDLIGTIWEDRPILPVDPVFLHDEKFTGRSIHEKIAQVREKMKAFRVDHFLTTALDEIAWLFNLRGRDIAFNPVFYAHAVIESNRALLFIEADKVPEPVRQFLAGAGVELRPYEMVYDYLGAYPENERLYLSSAAVNFRLWSGISCNVVDGEAWITGMKAVKNETEIAHFRQVMEKDAVALVRLYRWLEDTLQQRTVSEYELAVQLAAFRSELEGYYGESFGAIAGYGANGAIVHYSPKENGSAQIKKEGILLLDSGGQYVDGTTDITRTTALGPVTDEQKKHFTLVLKGHIALDQLEFPEGTNGYQLDAFARQYLWQHGFNFFHGTGHGVGFFLNVHEGPHGISFVWSGRSNRPLVPGMVTSNEPGLYLEGQYGIRIENLILTRVVRETPFGKFLGHETLTLFPIDKNLIDTGLLTKPELQWIDDYHQMVYDRVKNHLNDAERAWLRDKCAPIERR
jgi:Xaa-Pro aminopeptidase